ncbi:MAG: SPASM domain-containing protein [bacterium]|nr:SPASM domain-containing protein [bacterium]
MSDDSTLKPFHLFRKFDEAFVYSLNANRFMHIDPVTYDFLAECLHSSIDDARRSLVGQEKHPLDAVEEVAEEARVLAAEGFFETPDFAVSAADSERVLEARNASPWKRLELALAEDCNLACTYCYCDLPTRGGEPGLMPRETAKKAVDWLMDAAKDSPKISLTLLGGEPLLNREGFRFVVDYAHERATQLGKEIFFSLTTNGTLLDDMSIDRIKKHNFGLMVSLDGPPAVHDGQCPARDGSGSFETAAKGIRRLMARRRRVTVRCTLTKSSPPLMELIPFFLEFGFTRLAFCMARNPANPTPVDCGPAMFEEIGRQEDEEVVPWVLSELDKGRMPEHFPYGPFISEQASSTPNAAGVCRIRCGACHGTTTVGTDGTLYPCHRFVGMREFRMGTIDSGPDVDRAGRFWRDYSAAVEDTCSKCWARLLCKGPCPWTVARNDGTFGGCEDWQCAFIRRNLERSAWMLWRVQSEYPVIYAQLAGYNEVDREKEDQDIDRTKERSECQGLHHEQRAGVAAQGNAVGGMTR